MNLEKIDIESIVNEVISKMDSGNCKVDNTTINTDCNGNYGIFSNMESAVNAACKSQKELLKLTLKERANIIEAMRKAILDNIEEISKLSVSETGLGEYEDKIQKNKLAAQKTPGIEDIEALAYTGDDGFTLVERAPFGVIGAITPSTNPSETVICNGIGMIAAGNSVVFNSHPGAKEVTALTITLLNKAIIEAKGPANLLCVVDKPTMETGQILMTHPKTRLLVVTGGPEIVKVAMNSGKKVIAAGPGNPPVIVDETANIKMAAKHIADGASFDNNVLCIAEKEVFVVDCVANGLVKEMVNNGCYLLNNSQIEKISEKICVKNKNGTIVPNKKYVGKNIKLILNEIGIDINDKNIKLAIAEVNKNHPLVYMEQLMPILPIVRVEDINEAINEAYKAEQQNFHTAMMHSTNVENLSNAAKTMNTSIFVKNAPSYAGLGMGGEGFTTFTIASPTGEGLTSPITFTRQRRCVLKDQFRIV